MSTRKMAMTPATTLPNFPLLCIVIKKYGLMLFLMCKCFSLQRYDFFFNYSASRRLILEYRRSPEIYLRVKVPHILA